MTENFSASEVDFKPITYADHFLCWVSRWQPLSLKWTVFLVFWISCYKCDERVRSHLIVQFLSVLQIGRMQTWQTRAIYCMLPSREQGNGCKCLVSYTTCLLSMARNSIGLYPRVVYAKMESRWLAACSAKCLSHSRPLYYVDANSLWFVIYIL